MQYILVHTYEAIIRIRPVGAGLAITSFHPWQPEKYIIIAKRHNKANCTNINRTTASSLKEPIDGARK
jgi:hypothetical protein